MTAYDPQPLGKNQNKRLLHNRIIISGIKTIIALTDKNLWRVSVMKSTSASKPHTPKRVYANFFQTCLAIVAGISILTLVTATASAAPPLPGAIFTTTYDGGAGMSIWYNALI